jgi:hypothetical protein
MLDFLYNETYCDHRKSDGTRLQSNLNLPQTLSTPIIMNGSDYKTGSANALLTNALVYIIAYRYNIEPLKELSFRKYEEVMPVGWNSYPFIESLRILYENDRQSDEILKGVSVTAVENPIRDFAGRHKDAALDILNALFSNGQRKHCLPTPSSKNAAWHCHQCSRIYY